MLWIQQELEYDYALFKNWINVLKHSRTHQITRTKPNSYRNPFFGHMNQLKQGRTQMHRLKLQETQLQPQEQKTKANYRT